MVHPHIHQALVRERIRDLLVQAETARRAGQAHGQRRRLRRGQLRPAAGVPGYTDIGAEVITAAGRG
jgi:hypothetical protein